jgi:hypothetical protein
MRPSAFPELLISLVSLIGIFCLPSGLESAFDGLPWSRDEEVLVIVGFLPFLLLTGWRFITRRFTVLALMLLCGIKIVLAVGAPAGGWSLRIYEHPEAWEKGLFEVTYEGIWQTGVSGLLDRPFTEQRDFPLEWINRYNTEAQRAALRPVLEISGKARLPRGWGIALVAGGGAKAEVWVTDSAGRKTFIPLSGDIRQVTQLAPATLPQGNLDIRGRIFYGNIQKKDWSLIPVIMNTDKKIAGVFGKEILWRDQAGIDSTDFGLTLYRVLTRLIGAGVILFLLCWLVWTFRLWQTAGVMTFGLAALIGLTWGVPLLLRAWGIHFLDSLRLKMVLILLLFSWLARQREQENRSWGPHLGLVVLLAVGPAILSHFFLVWGGEAGRMSNFSVGDDWLTYQRLAREIVLGGDPWQRSDPVFHVQPLYRWLVALGHIFFGQSTLSLRLLDVWSVVAAGCLLASLAWRLGASPPIALLGSLVYLKLEFDLNFYRLIGSGLQEQVALLFLILPGWAVIKARDDRLGIILGAGCLAALGFWLRMDHLGCLAGLGLLMLGPVEGGTRDAWRQWLACLKRKRGTLVLYWTPLALAVLAVLVRNWIFSGRLALHDPGYLEWLTRSIKDNLAGMLILLSATEQGLSPAGWFIWSGTGLGLLALFIRPGPFRFYPLSLGITLGATLAPYFYARVSCYTPRFSIHLLPLAILSLCLIAQQLWTWFIPFWKTWGNSRV